MNRFFQALLVSLLLAGAASASASTSAVTIDTGTPNGNPIGAYLIDSNDYYAGQVRFVGTATVQSLFAHILGGNAGDTFTIALYGDSATHAPGSLLYSTQATFTADGWNGASSLNGWTVAAGLYWVAFEVGFNDTLGAGALLDRSVPNPLARTAFDPTGFGNYQVTAAPLTFGLRVGALVVPEPGSMALLFAGAAVLLGIANRRTGRAGR